VFRKIRKDSSSLVSKVCQPEFDEDNDANAGIQGNDATV
jgi:hypothetical protein